MNLTDSFRVTWMNLKANPFRSLMSILGIIIGISTVIIVISIANGTKEQALREIGAVDSYIYTLIPNFNRMTGQVTLVSSDIKSFTSLSFVKTVLPRFYRNFDLRTPKKIFKQMVTPMDIQYLKSHRLSLLSGRNINDFDLLERARVCMITEKLAHLLFNEPNPLKKTLHCGRIELTVVGIFQSEFDSFDPISWSEDEIMDALGPTEFLMPYTTVLRLEQDMQIDALEIYVDKNYQGPVMKKLALALVNQGHHENDFTIQDPREILAQIEKQSRLYATFLASLASISLLVGGIGIANVMIASVAERTREIGIRKAIGASQRDILFQFVIEACILCAVGGMMGILLGVMVSYCLPLVTHQKVLTLISFSSIPIALIFSIVVGLFFGVFPALKAARLSPIEALRTE